MKIISRKEAKALGLKRYFTGKPCLWGHLSERHTINSRCAICNNTHVDREKKRSRNRRFKLNNKMRLRPQKRTWHRNRRYKERAAYQALKQLGIDI